MFNKTIEFEKQGACVGNNNMCFNCTIEKNQLMNGSVSWRGSGEKYPISNIHWDIVWDWNGSCWYHNFCWLIFSQHLVAYEVGNPIFNNLIL